MRRATDQGVVALLDPRIARKGRGRAMLGQPPARPEDRLPEEVARFFAKVPSREVDPTGWPFPLARSAPRNRKYRQEPYLQVSFVTHAALPLPPRASSSQRNASRKGSRRHRKRFTGACSGPTGSQRRFGWSPSAATTPLLASRPTPGSSVQEGRGRRVPARVRAGPCQRTEGTAMMSAWWEKEAAPIQRRRGGVRGGLPGVARASDQAPA